MPTPLVLESSVNSDIEAPVASGETVVPFHIVAFAMPAPTLVDGRPT
jgi:hypothetical protein